MQGRLTKPIRKPIQEFPIENWENEIGLLNKLNFKAIEWIIDLYSYEKNPILASRDLVNDILNKNKIKISAISNDYFLDLGNQIGQISYKQMCEIIKRQEETISEAEVQLVTVNKDGKPIKIPEILEKLFD